MRPLVMDFPSDTEGHDCNSEYMFGKSLLVVPVVNAQYTPETVVISTRIPDGTNPT